MTVVLTTHRGHHHRFKLVDAEVASGGQLRLVVRCRDLGCGMRESWFLPAAEVVRLRSEFLSACTACERSIETVDKVDA